MKKFAVLVLGILLAAHCNKSGVSWNEGNGIAVSETGVVRVTDPALMTPEQKYHSPENPGPWENEKETHNPVLEITPAFSKNQWIINATIPLRASDKHYIENIILLDNRGKELQKEDLPRATPDPSATFIVTRDTNIKLYILAKCNLHDIWVTPVSLPGSK